MGPSCFFCRLFSEKLYAFSYKAQIEIVRPKAMAEDHLLSQAFRSMSEAEQR